MEKSITKNFVYSMVYRLFLTIFPLIVTPYVSRVLGVQGIGRASYTGSIQSYFTLFAALGTGAYGSIEISKKRDDIQEVSRIFWEVEIVSVFTSLLTLAVWLGMVCISGENQIIYLIKSISFFTIIFDISWFFGGLEEVKVTVVRNIVFTILNVVAILTLINDENDLVLYIFLSVIFGLCSSISLWLLLPKYIAKCHIDLKNIKQHIKGSLVFFIPGMATTIYTVIDKSLLGLLSEDYTESGFYAQASFIVAVSKTVAFTVINGVICTRNAYLFENERYDEIHSRKEFSLGYLMFFGMGIVFGLLALSDYLVPVYFGDGFERVIYLLRLMSPVILIIGVSFCLGSQYYTPSGRRIQSSRYLLVGMVVNLILNCIMIPRWWGFGAVIATLIAESVITTLYIRNCNGFITVKSLVMIGWKKMVAGIAMLLVLLRIKAFFPICILGLIELIIIGVCIYTAMLLVLRDNFLKSAFIKLRRQIVTIHG